MQHIQHIGIAHFIRQCKTKHIKITDRTAGFQRIQRDLFFLHERFHIHPWRIYPLGQRIAAFIDHAVNDLQPQMAHGHFIDIRKGQCHMQIHTVMILDHAVPLSANVAGWFLNVHQPHGINIYLFHTVSCISGAYAPNFCRRRASS